MFRLLKRKRVLLPVVVVMLLGAGVGAWAASGSRPVVLGQTEGFANGKLVVFDYGDNFICANAPLNDEECQLGAGVTPASNPGIDPAKAALLNRLDLNADTLDLVVIVPFFDTDGDGTIDALEDPATTAPGQMVFVQCPETQSSALAGGSAFGKFGHCIFHDHALDTAPLAGVTVSPPGGASDIPLGGVIPLPNHDHIVKDTPGGSVPWKTSAVLVFDPSIWPDMDGQCTGSPCLTSFEALREATQASVVTTPGGPVLDGTTGQIFGPVDTSLFLFFGVHGLGS